MALRSIAASHSVLVCVGSGGVGKTTTAAALALGAAIGGQKVLCLTVDPARRLANSLGLSEMKAEGQEIDVERFQKEGIQMTGSLTAMMLDPKQTFDELVNRYASSEAARDRILNNRFYQYVSSSLAGTSEYMAMEKLFAVRQSGEWDLIVLDTPPTANAIDFLEAPERMIELVDSPAMRWFLAAFESNGKFSFNLLSKGAALVFRGLARFTGGEFLDLLAQFVRDLNDLFGGFRERALLVSTALRSSDVAFIVVTSPHPLSMAEAGFLAGKLTDAELSTDAFVVNGVHLPLVGPAPKAEAVAELETLLAASPEGAPAAPKLWRRMLRSFEDHQKLSVADAFELEALRARVAPLPCIVVPALSEDVHSLRSLFLVSEYLGRETQPQSGDLTDE